MQNNIKNILEQKEKARQHICDLASGKKKFTMSVPVQDDDSDLLLTSTLDYIDELIERLQNSIGVMNSVQNIIRPYTKGDSTLSNDLRNAWNVNARFLSANPELQNVYLESLRTEVK